jgi:hypothetical protein
MQRRTVRLSPPVLLAAQATPDVGLSVRGGGRESGVACDTHPTPTRRNGVANERRSHDD